MLVEPKQDTLNPSVVHTSRVQSDEHSLEMGEGSRQAGRGEIRIDDASFLEWKRKARFVYCSSAIRRCAERGQ